ncbi:hypothetical protein AB1L42_04160 [Thalassoglobus sp. JC818]|uniref:hypothetical protein n=1 Tax=Thalassoglobus sp. JC818 TaxID=3232136 RepID=UPI0034591C83
MQIFGGTSVFPLTRQSYQFVTAWHVLALFLFGGTSIVFAQNGEQDADEEAVVEEFEPDDWTPPDWWMDQVASETFRRQEKLKINGLKSNNPNRQQVEGLKKLAHYYLSLLTYPENRAKIPREVTQRFLSELLSTLNRAGGRAALMDEIIEKSKDLMNHPSEQVRTNVALLLIQLSIEPSDFQTKTPAVPYNPVYEALLEILQDSSQIQEVRIVAANGLTRLCRDGQNAPSSTERSEIADALTSQLQATPPSADEGVEWYRRRMIQALGFVGRIDNVSGQPVVIDELMSVIRNKQETWVNRAEACQSITQLPYTSSVNVELITHEICRFLEAMVRSQGFSKAPSANLWIQAFSRVYLAFRPATQADAEIRNYGLLYQVKRPGLGGQEAYVRAAFEKALPVLTPVLTNVSGKPALSKSAFDAFSTWVSSNPPSSRKLTTGGQDIPE